MATTYAIPNGATEMAVTTYAGTGATNVLSNGTNNPTATTFQPDLVWIKVRTNAYYHKLFDSVRGANKALSSNATDAESTETQGLLSFNSNGFTLGTSSDSTVNNAGSGQTYVAWQWKAGGTAVSNTAGTITSSVSANPTAGFSVVTFTTPSTNTTSTIGHGLGVAPSLIIVKSRSTTSSWYVYHSSLGATKAVFLNTTAASDTSQKYWNNTSPTSSVFTIMQTGVAWWDLSATHVAYCFSEVAGYSKFGSYTGNGSADGPFVFLNFQPRYILLKSTSTGDWVTYDSSRNPYNVEDLYLYPNSSAAEAGSGTPRVDFLSNGFKIRNSGQSNVSGETIIYMAFASNPLKYSNAR